MHDIIVFALPVFALLIAIEFTYGWIKGRNTYELGDTLNSLGQGLLSQAVAICTPLFQIGIYAWVYPRVAVLHNEAAWNTWFGWLAAVLLYDFCDYWLHRAGHESAIFWAAHVVHHQSQHFNLSTALRQESAYALLGWMFYLPMALIGVPPEIFGLAGLAVLIYQFWIHTEHIGRLGWFDRIFSSPSNHRVHHATNERYLDKNYGAILVVWDRMFGTFQPETEPCVYGTTVPLNSWNPLKAVGRVYVALCRQAWHTVGWKNKLQVFWRAPGWQAPGQAQFVPPSVGAVPLYAPAMTTAQRWAACVLFGVVTGVVGCFLWLADDLSPAVQWVWALAVIAGLWLIGVITEWAKDTR